jgi:asparagine N-glycosylation enzyme membrane subunit Stt3
LEIVYEQVYNLLFEENILKVNVGYVNIFEYVKNAKVTGNASPNKTIKISTTIFTDQNRAFEYSQSTTSDSKGNYEFIVPLFNRWPDSRRDSI